MKELVSFRGSNDGLRLILSPDVKSFSEIESKVIQKLQFTPDFFQPDTKLILDRCFLSPEDQLELFNLFAKYNLKLVIKSSVYRGSSKKHKIVKVEENLPPKDLIIKRTIRGGEKIAHSGNIIIYGNINPSAHITAGGNIDIHGACKGIVCAGKNGDAAATIIADELSPSQIKIGDVIAISPENLEEVANPVTEQAVIEDGKIVFKPYHRK